MPASADIEEAAGELAPARLEPVRPGVFADCIAEPVAELVVRQRAPTPRCDVVVEFVLRNSEKSGTSLRLVRSPSAEDDDSQRAGHSRPLTGGRVVLHQ
jgi:hypothetical protein